YFRQDQPQVDRLEFQLVDGRPEAIERLKRGEVDLVSGLYEEDVAKSALDAQQVVQGKTPSVWFLGFNVQHAPYDDVRVRQAIRSGLDIQALVEQFHPGARAAKQLTPPSILEMHEGTLVPRPDVTTSQRLLREANITKLRLTLYYPPGRSTEPEDSVLFRPLIEAGLIELNHVPVDDEDFWRRQREGRVPSFRAGWIADYPDADNFLHFLLNSKAQTVYGLGYVNQELDRLTEEARVSIDPDLRTQLYRKAEKLLQRDCPLIPLYHERSYAAASPGVQGMRLQQTLPQVRFEQLWLDRE
ncbi:MAG: ABC transporter substrate-binding protein, partial [Myxococcaceae bacterium]